MKLVHIEVKIFGILKKLLNFQNTQYFVAVFKKKIFFVSKSNFLKTKQKIKNLTLRNPSKDNFNYSETIFWVIGRKNKV